MDKNTKGEIRYHLKNIIEVMLFLLVFTWIWYGPYQTFQKQTEKLRKNAISITGVSVEEQERIAINNENRSGKYQFTLKNNTNEKKEILAKITLDYNKIAEEKNKILSNNQINYYLMQKDEQDLTPRVLSMNGDILVTTLQPQEQRKYLLNYFIDKETDLDKKSFYGKVIVSNNKKI